MSLAHVELAVELMKPPDLVGSLHLAIGGEAAKADQPVTARSSTMKTAPIT